MPTPFFADLVRELAQEGGTGPLTPTGAVPGHRRFSGVVPPGVSFHYAIAGIAHPDEWEVGTGRIGGDGRLLRDMVTASSNDGAAVDFTAGLKTIALTVGAGWFAASDTQAATLAGEVAGLGSGLASLTGALDTKQPLSTLHDSSDAGEATDAVTVRRGAGWVNVPLSALVFRDAGGNYALQAPLAAASGQAVDVRRSTDGDVLDVGQDGGHRLRVFINADTIGLFNVAGAGAGRDGVRILDGAVAFDIAATEAGRFTANGLGIGIAAPQTALDIAKADQSVARVRIRNTAAGGHMWDIVSGIHNASQQGLSFFNATNLVTAMVMDGAGQVGIGQISPQRRLHVRSTGEIARFETTASSGNGYIGIEGPAGSKAWWGFGGSNNICYIMQQMNEALVLGSNGLTRWHVAANGMFFPASDNSYDVGVGGSNRVRDLFLVNSPTVTSDERDKTWRGAPTEAELRAARRIAAELGFYRWNDAIAAKGADDARMHFGVRAQAAWAIMADEGLIDPIVEGVDPSSRYAFLCWDSWDAVEPVTGVRDADDNILIPAQPGRPTGDRFGIRIDQLMLFLIAAQEARIAALEAAA